MDMCATGVGVGLGVDSVSGGLVVSPNDPTVTPVIELMTADGVFLVTADGNYLGTVG